MNVLIIEDEKLAAENLKSLLRSIDGDIRVLDSLDSVRRAVKWLSENRCDLIFMDIQLSDGNSFQIFEQVEVKTPVIFTTAYDQYAIKAFKHNSIDYLLKPINANELSSSIEKFKEFQGKPQIDVAQLLESIRNPFQYRERFLVSFGMKMKTIKTSEIAFLFVQGNGVFVCTSDNKQYNVDFTLDKLEEILDPRQFFRINRQYIVHIDAIKNMDVVSKSRLKLELHPKAIEEVIVSVNNVHDFKIWLNK